MELTLIPIAAILLLLTGFSTPAQPGTEAVSSAAVLRFWLGRDRAPKDRCPIQRSAQASSGRVISAWVRNAAARAHEVGTTLAVQAVRRHPRTVFRTRFGVATGAYRSTAPPRRA